MPCGLILNYELPKGADSIHVVVYKNDSVRHVFRDSLFCSSCGNEVVVQKGTEDFRKKYDWEYGEYQVEEIVYCNGKQTVFSAIPLTLKKGFISIIDVAYSDYLGSKDKRYLPSQNECGIDSTYVIFIEHSDYCAE